MNTPSRFFCGAALVALLVVSTNALAQTTQTEALSPTPSSGTGPEYLDDMPFRTTLWRDGDPGDRLLLSGRVMNLNGEPVAGAIVDVWQADGAGSYHDDAYRGKVKTDSTGRYAVRTAVPGNDFGAKHIHMMVSHDGYGTVTTRVLFKGDGGLSGWDAPNAVVLEETRLDDDLVYVGSFDVVMPNR